VERKLAKLEAEVERLWSQIWFQRCEMTALIEYLERKHSNAFSDIALQSMKIEDREAEKRYWPFSDVD